MMSYLKRAAVVLLGVETCLSVAQLTISSTPAQTMNGIGASGAWWPISLARFPDSARNLAADLLFNKSNLALQSYRYNVGGGGVFVGDLNRAPQTFFVSPGVYNWSADPQGVFFLKKAAAYGVPQLTAFVNSAPTAFTSNVRNCGGQIVNASIQGYTDYLADVIAHWKTQGVVFTHVSPMNEPDNSFGSGDSTPCGQEGMIVAPNQRAQVVNTLRSSLNSRGLQSVRIMSDESSATGNFISEAATWIPSAASNLGEVCHHNYGFANDATAAQMGSLGRNLSGGKETWFSEICCFKGSATDPAAAVGWGQGFDPTMLGGLQMANLIYQSFTKVLDTHFDWWTALSDQLGCSPTSSSTCPSTSNSAGWDDGLIYFDTNASSNFNFALYTVRRFFVLKHFTTSIPIGSVRHDVTAGLPSRVQALAFTLPNGGGTSLILLNMNTSGSVTLNLGRTVVRGAQTSPATQWTVLSSGGTSVVLPAMSVTSVVM